MSYTYMWHQSGLVKSSVKHQDKLDAYRYERRVNHKQSSIHRYICLSLMKIVEQGCFPSHLLLINAITTVKLNGKMCDANRIPAHTWNTGKTFHVNHAIISRCSIVLGAILIYLKLLAGSNAKEHSSGTYRDVICTPKST